MLNLLVETVQDPVVRENFKQFQVEIRSNPFLAGNWILREYTFSAAVTALKIPHGLSFTPKDVILTNITGAGAITINYVSFTATDIVVTTTDACVARLLIGRFGA